MTDSSTCPTSTRVGTGSVVAMGSGVGVGTGVGLGIACIVPCTRASIVASIFGVGTGVANAAALGAFPHSPSFIVE